MPLLLVLAVGLTACDASRPELTIIVVSLDTTRPDHLSAYGYDRETSPTLAKLAREGVVFDSCRATSSWTLPSHMSLFTGVPPQVHDVIVDFKTLAESRRTMGQVFKQEGYRTVGLFTAPYVHGHFGFDRGFDVYESMTLEPSLFDLPPRERAKQLGFREFQSHREVTSRRLTNQGIATLMRGSYGSHLLFLHYFDPHYDYLAPRDYARNFTSPGYAGPITGESPTGSPDVHVDMPAEDLAHLQSLYDAELRWVDDNLGRLIRYIENKRDPGSTLLVVTGDHGEEFFEHGRFGHRMNLNDTVLRVPLLVWGPGLVPADRRVPDDVSICDVLPTVMDYAGFPTDPAMTGRSLRPLIDGEQLDGDSLVAASLSFFPADGPGYYVQHDALVRDGLKAVRQVHREWTAEGKQQFRTDGPEIPGTEQFEVYDTRNDPGETDNLWAHLDSLDDALAQRVRSLVSDLADQHRGLDAAADKANTDTSTDLLDMLDALGYRDTQESGQDEGAAASSSEDVPDKG